MKLVLCAYDRPNYINGPNVWLQRLLPELRSMGVECRVLFFPKGNVTDCATIQALVHEGVTCECYKGKKFTEFQIRWILNRIDKTQPDVFLPNLCVPAYHASKWIKRSGIPTVGILHSDDDFYRTLVKEFVLKKDSDHLSALVGVSSYLVDYCEKTVSGKIAIHRIPYGVPVPDKPSVNSGGDLKIIYAGRLVEEQKRVSDVTRALCRMALEVPGTEGTLYGSGASMEGLRQIIADGNVADKIKLGGLLDHHQLQDKLLTGHVFLLLSDYEGLPIALMEAMACGVVPVCYDMKSGVSELVKHDHNGFVVKDRGDEVISAIKALKSDLSTWERLSGEARNTIERGYSSRSSAEKWCELLKHLAEGSRINEKIKELPSSLKLPPRPEEMRKSEDQRWPGYPTYLFRRFKKRAARVWSQSPG